MRIHSVILDANILIRDYKFNGREIRKLTKTKNLYSFSLCIPEVVYDECIGNYVADSRSRIEKLIKAVEEVNEIIPNGDRIKKDVIERRLKGCAEKYRKRLNKLISANKITILKYPKISHKHVVGRMYEKNQPFNNGSCSEKGYKDYLIAESIREYLSDNTIDGRVIFVTNNAKDFIENNSPVEKDRVMSLAKTFNLDSAYVTTSLAVLFDELRQNLKEKSTYHEVTKSAAGLSKGIEKSIIQDHGLIKMDIFGLCLFDIRIDKLRCEVLDCAIELDEESDVIEVSGIFKLSVSCSFEVDNYDLNHLEGDFPFMNQVLERVKLKKFSSKDDWVEHFNDLDYKGEFIFNYIDFDYSKNKFPKEIDPTFLSISKI